MKREVERPSVLRRRRPRGPSPWFLAVLVAALVGAPAGHAQGRKRVRSEAKSLLSKARDYGQQTRDFLKDFSIETDENPASLFSRTFDCFTAGASTVADAIPCFEENKYGAYYSRPDRIQAARTLSYYDQLAHLARSKKGRLLSQKSRLGILREYRSLLRPLEAFGRDAARWIEASYVECPEPPGTKTTCPPNTVVTLCVPEFSGVVYHCAKDSTDVAAPARTFSRCLANDLARVEKEIVALEQTGRKASGRTR